MGDSWVGVVGLRYSEKSSRAPGGRGAKLDFLDVTVHETEGLFAPATENAHESLWKEELNKQLAKRVTCFPSAARRRLS